MDKELLHNKFFIGELEFCGELNLDMLMYRVLSQHFKGQISNVCIVKGTALYDPTSTSVSYPTAPLTNVTNTKLLCCTSPTSETTTILPDSLLNAPLSIQAFH